ncbi:MAG TPA: glycosyltransferase family 2 protein [Chitinophagales bacterium]|nr:glycosyltransferase family 2 protein [Chitinophagales bacterium]
MKKVSIIIPCYNEAQVLPKSIMQLLTLKDEIKSKGCEVEFVMVNDGSTDDTLNKLVQFKSEMPEQVRIVQLTGNFGSYNALLAGCHYATGDCCVQLHADLQDPPSHIPLMIDHWMSGFKLVIGQRVKREAEDLFYGISARIYHLMMKNAMPYIPDGGYDLILFDREICDHLVRINETNTNLVYLISWLRYPYAVVPVIRGSRRDGKSKWNFPKRTKLVIDSFVAFSYLPIRIVTLTGILSVFAFIAASVLVFTVPWFTVWHWVAALLTMMLFVNLSIIAEYLWRDLEASRKRPPFVVDKVF